MTMDGYIDNSIEFLKGEDTATVTFSQGRCISKIKRLAKERPEEVEIVTDAEGILCAHIPVSWIKIYPNPQYSEEQKEELKKRLQNAQ